MSPADYDFVVNFLARSSGLSLGPDKVYLVESRLLPLAASLGYGGLDDLIAELRKGTNGPVSTAVTEAMTTNETSFFRDKTPFEDMKTTLIPSLIRARAHVKKLRCWCAAASTGQEPYSLLMLLEDSFPELRQWSVEIVATDIAKTMIDRCREGNYSQFEVQRGLPIQLLVKHFVQRPNGWQIQETLRRKINWSLLNLLDRFDQLGPFDLILCRNVLIYFDVPHKKDILERMARSLRPDGYLLLGAAETVLGICNQFDRFRACTSAVYAHRSTASRPVPRPVAASLSASR